MKTLSNFIKWFLYITAGILIICAVTYTLYGEATMPTVNLWNILLAAFLTAIVTALLYPRGYDPSKKGHTRNPLYLLPEGMILPAQFLLHYAALCAVMIPCGHRFGWNAYTLSGTLTMLADVAFVYILVFLVYYLFDLKEANEINRKLREQYREE